MLGANTAGSVEQAGVELDMRGNVRATMKDYTTSQDSVFAFDDMRRGQSLVVWAIKEGRQCARAMDPHWMGGRNCRSNSQAGALA